MFWKDLKIITRIINMKHTCFKSLEQKEVNTISIYLSQKGLTPSNGDIGQSWLQSSSQEDQLATTHRHSTTVEILELGCGWSKPLGYRHWEGPHQKGKRNGYAETALSLPMVGTACTQQASQGPGLLQREKEAKADIQLPQHSRIRPYKLHSGFASQKASKQRAHLQS